MIEEMSGVCGTGPQALAIAVRALRKRANSEKQAEGTQK